MFDFSADILNETENILNCGEQSLSKHSAYRNSFYNSQWKNIMKQSLFIIRIEQNA
jgi:hypothetical protein